MGSRQKVVVTHLAQLGDHVEKGDKLAIIADPFGNYLDSLESPAEGVVVVNKIFHLPKKVKRYTTLHTFQSLILQNT